MIDFLKNLWNKIWNSSLGGYIVESENRTICIVHGGEPICTMIVEGAGLVEIPNHKSKSLDS